MLLFSKNEKLPLYLTCLILTLLKRNYSSAFASLPILEIHKFDSALDSLNLLDVAFEKLTPASLCLIQL